MSCTMKTGKSGEKRLPPFSVSLNSCAYMIFLLASKPARPLTCRAAARQLPPAYPPSVHVLLVRHSRTRQGEDITESSNACHGYYVTSAHFSTELSTLFVDNSFSCDHFRLFRCIQSSDGQVFH